MNCQSNSFRCSLISMTCSASISASIFYKKMIWACILASCWEPSGILFIFVRHLFLHRFLDTLFPDFWFHLGDLGATLLIFGRKWLPQRTGNPFRGNPFSVPGRVRNITSILDGSGMDFGWILNGFGMDFEWILVGFWIDFLMDLE